jgi:hypothetical protein
VNARKTTVIVGSALVIAVVAVSFLLLRPGTSSGATIEEAGVRVDVRHLASDGVVEATFTPLREGFHLYGPDLPREGIEGAGRPTLLELAPGSRWRASGPVSSEPTTSLQTLPTFEDPFSVFPAGPATLRLPVQSAANGGDAELSVAVTFMACSDAGICLAPVEGRIITIDGT